MFVPASSPWKCVSLGVVLFRCTFKYYISYVNIFIDQLCLEDVDETIQLINVCRLLFCYAEATTGADTGTNINITVTLLGKKIAYWRCNST